MRIRPVLSSSAFVLATASGAVRAQCPTESFAFARGAVGVDRAIVVPAGGPVHARFLEKGPTGWAATQSLEIGDYSVFLPPTAAMDGARAIAGCPEATSGSVDLAGRAFLFDLVGGRWFATELVPASIGFADWFGTAVALSGDVAVVGAPHFGPDGLGDRLPRVHVFEFDGTSWSEAAQITTYGESIAVDGDRIAIGDGKSTPGRVYVHERVSGIWSWTAQVQSYASPNGPRLGSSVALQGDRLLAGAAPFTGEPGSVFVFTPHPTGGWDTVQEIVPSVREAGDRFGASLALDGSTLLVGAPGALHACGKVFRFEFDGTRYVERDSFGPEVRDFDRFGTAVSVQGEDAFVAGEQIRSHLYRLGFEHAVAYCPTTRNSSGAHGSLAAVGCDSRSGAKLTLVASDLPPGVLARAFFGASTAFAPYGDGFRCVGTPLFRLPGGRADASGTFAHEVDLTSGPASHLVAGRTWNFQIVHRDRAGTGINLTKGLAVGITP